MKWLVLLLAVSAYCADLGFLGPRGTFSDQAAETYRQHTPGLDRTLPFESMTAIVDAVAAGRIASGIIPVASTVAGFPAESARLLPDCAPCVPRGVLPPGCQDLRDGRGHPS